MRLNNSIEYMITVPLPHGAEGYIIIDSLYNGTSSGGLRIAIDITPDEITSLAREMSLKYALTSLPRGGAKSGIRMSGQTSPDEKKDILYNFGVHCRSIINAGIYYPGMDMNCGKEDLRTLYAGAGIPLRDIADTSFHTALTAEAALNAVGEFNNSSAPLSVAIEGFGAVANHLFPRLSLSRFKIQAVSTVAGAVFEEKGFNPSRLVELRDRHGDTFIEKLIYEGAQPIDPKENLLTLDIDVLVPSARVGVIHEGNVRDIKARYIVPVSNAPYVGDTASLLHARGIICLPGYACNSGGVLGASLQDLGWERGRVERFIRENYQPFILELLNQARQVGISPVYLTKRIAQTRLESRGQSSQRGGVEILSRLAQRGLYPRFLANRSAIQEITAGIMSLQPEIRQHSTRK